MDIPADADELIRSANSAYSARDWSALRLLYHPDALIVSVAAGDAVLSRDELIDALVTATSSVVYRATFTRADVIDGGAALVVSGRVRHRRERGFADNAW